MNNDQQLHPSSGSSFASFIKTIYSAFQLSPWQGAAGLSARSCVGFISYTGKILLMKFIGKEKGKSLWLIVKVEQYFSKLKQYLSCRCADCYFAGEPCN